MGGSFLPYIEPIEGLREGKAHLRPPNQLKPTRQKQGGGRVGTHESRGLLGQGEGPINPKKRERKEKRRGISGPTKHIGPIKS